MTPVLVTLLFGTQSEKDELGNEVKGAGSSERQPLTP